METDKLINMVDFVLQQEQNCVPIKYTETINPIFWYANFLKQPLTLGMFVPVDENGNPLSEPYNDGMNDLYYYSAIDAYNKAKSRVLFEEFQITNDMYKHTKRTFVEKESLRIFLRLEFYSGEIRDTLIDGSVESLIKHNLTLTQTAKKQIYGNE